MSIDRSDVPTPVVRRLSQYLRQLEALAAQETTTVSSRALAAGLGLTDAQVRKDLALFGQFGRPGVGYEVAPLINRLRRILGTDRVTNTLLVGVGNIGRALAHYKGFKSKGFELVALFDADPKMIGRTVASLTVQSMHDLQALVRELDIRLGIVAVPAESAQTVVDQLAAAGVRGILNFAPTAIAVPKDVTVCNLDVGAELEQLSFLTTFN